MKLAFIFLVFFSFEAPATELTLSAGEAERQGYLPLETSPEQFYAEPKPHQLDWPFEKMYSRGAIGNNFAQFQPYQTVIYHAGTDIILEPDSWVFAPISGKLEAADFGSTLYPDGSKKRHFKPWPDTVSERYFGFAITDASGWRFELLHVKRDSLPQSIVDCLDRGNCTVTKGEKLGKAVQWFAPSNPVHYDHIHVSVYAPDGRDLNPEYFFKLFPDRVAPKIKVLSQFANGKTSWFENGDDVPENVKAFIIVGADQTDRNVFVQEPSLTRARFQSGQSVEWDFTYSFFDPVQKFKDIRNVYPIRIQLPNGATFKQPADYYPTAKVQFAIRLAIPNGASGPFEIEAADLAGNSTKLSGFLRPNP